MDCWRRAAPVRHAHGSQYMSDHFQNELAFLGIESSPAFVRAPEGNGCAERFIRTLKENLLWVQTFDTIEQLRHALIKFQEVYNTTCPDQPRQRLFPVDRRRTRALCARRPAAYSAHDPALLRQRPPRLPPCR